MVFNDASMKLHSAPHLYSLYHRTLTSALARLASIWSSIDARTQQQQRLLLLESSCPLTITIYRTCTRTLHIQIPISTSRIMYIRVDRIRGLIVSLAALCWSLDEMLLRATTANDINGIAMIQPPSTTSLTLPITATNQNRSLHLRHHS